MKHGAAIRMLAFASGLASCNHTPTRPAECTGPIQVSVDTRTLAPTRPVFHWTPRCGTTDITVVTAPVGVGDPAVVWSLTVPESAAMAPPVAYGSAPRGAIVYIGPQPLTRGQTYRVSIASTIGMDVLGGIGEASFTP